MPPSLSGIIQLAERCIHVTMICKIAWKRLPDQWIKVNTDGSSIENLGKIGAGGILRHYEGKIILALT